MPIFGKQKGGCCCCCCCACYPRNNNTVIMIPGKGKERSQIVKVPGDANIIVVRKNDDQQQVAPAPQAQIQEKHKNDATSPSACNQDQNE